MDLEWISPRVPVPLLLCYFSCNEQGHTDSKRTESPYLDKPRADGLGAMLLRHAIARKQFVRESGLPEKMRRPGQLSPQGNIKRVIRRRNPARKPVKRRPDTTDMPFVSLILHALDLGDFLRQFLVAAGWDQLQVVSQEDLVLQFARRAAGDQTEAC